MNTLVGGTSIAPGSGNVVVLYQARFSGELDASTDPVAVALDADRLNQDPVVVVRGRVVEQFRRTTNDRHHGVDLPVVVEITESTTAVSSRDLEVRPGPGTHVPECAVLEVVEDG